MSKRQYNDAVRLCVAMIIFLWIIYVFKSLNPEKEAEIPVVYLPGISETNQQNFKNFDEVMAYLDEYYPKRTVREEMELLKRFSNPVVTIDNGENSASLYSEEDVEMLQKVLDAVTSTEFDEAEALKRIIMNRIEVETTPVKDAWYKNYTEKEIYMLAVLMYAEMEEYMNDVDAEKVAKAVGSVPLHRVKAQGYYPNDLESVIWQNYGKSGQQYATRTLNMISSNVKPPEKFYLWAEELLIEGPVGPDNLVFQDNQPHGDIWWQYGKIYFCTAEL